MNGPKNQDHETVVQEESADYFLELSEYLEVLSNSQRLKILKLLEKNPKDVRKIASEIDTSYENTKKHLDKLLSIGLIKKEAGLGQPTSKGIHPVWKYSLVPGAMEAIVRNLGLFSNIRIPLSSPALHQQIARVRGQLAEELPVMTAYVMVLGGPDDGAFAPLIPPEVRFGRGAAGSATERPGEFALSDAYAAVSRVTKPHLRFIEEKGEWYMVDPGSTGGTVLNTTPLEKNRRVLLKDGDMIELGKGPAGARLLVIIPGRPANPS